MKDDFARTYEAVDANFQEIFGALFPGGSAHLSLVDPDDHGEHGRGGVGAAARQAHHEDDRSCAAARSRSRLLRCCSRCIASARTPFYILDEVEAALDDTNLRRLIAYIGHRCATRTQLIMITHQRRTMEMADVLFGVSMQADGVTKVAHQKLDRALQYAE